MDASAMSESLPARTIIGMEIHVQLATRTKLFCGCELAFAAEPNSRTCPVCLGLPGVLPVMNQEAVRLAVIAGLALNCKIARFSKWDRKSYYYPDLPKNYQISQYDVPLCHGGHFDVPVGGHTLPVRIRRAHLEEDAGKNIHDRPGGTLVDLNRTGTPLLEIVTEPDIVSAEQAYAFCVELQRLVTYLGVSEGSMQMGHMRFEPNINVAIVENGVEYRTPISEVKNLNSFKAVRSAIEYEAARQVRDWRSDHGYVWKKRPNENRGWNDERQVTEVQRSKEEAHDYRYFPDPDLVPVELEAAWIEGLAGEIGELPLVRRRRYLEELQITEDEADLILSHRSTVELFDAAVEASGPAQLLGKQFANVWAKLAGERGGAIGALGVDGVRIAALAQMVHEGAISATAANTIAAAMLDSTELPEALAESLGLVKVLDVDQTAAWVDQALAQNESAIESILTNPKKAKASEGFLRGQVMRISGGKADPALVGELIAQKIAERRGSE
jgi:aspartyl-tRNA(Asn)/glutamyl-tRNA(Gln) amidotransferase subunit B